MPVQPFPHTLQNILHRLNGLCICKAKNMKTVLTEIFFPELITLLGTR